MTNSAQLRYTLWFMLSMLLLVFVRQPVLGQTDSLHWVQYNPDFKFEEGLFLDFDQVRYNRPIPKNRIITDLDVNRIDFFEQLLKSETLYVFDENGLETAIEITDLWGFCKKGTLFILYNDEFNRIPVVGSICHFVSTEKVVNSARSDMYNPYIYYDPFSYYPGRQQTYITKEMRQYLLDWKTGNVYPYNSKSLKIILMNDPELYEEFNALKKRKQKKLVFFYLRKYNERNPLMVPLYKETNP